MNTGVKSVRFSPGRICIYRTILIEFHFVDGADLAVGLQNGTICVFDVVGNGDFQLRTDGSSQVKNKLIAGF